MVRFDCPVPPLERKIDTGLKDGSGWPRGAAIVSGGCPPPAPPNEAEGDWTVAVRLTFPE